jgi:hypothetical protein
MRDDTLVIPDRPLAQPRGRARWPWIVAVLAAVIWSGNGLVVKTMLEERGDFRVDPFTHTVTYTTDRALPTDGWGAVGAMLGAQIGALSCEANAAKIAGFGWGVVLETADGRPLVSCWSWR